MKVLMFGLGISSTYNRRIRNSLLWINKRIDKKGSGGNFVVPKAYGDENQEDIRISMQAMLN